MSDPAPLLSIVVPVYGVEEYLPACLDSLLGDPVSDVEIIVVDDQSPDRSAEIASEYAARDSRVRVLRMPTNMGLGRARNAGLEMSRGEYVWFVDSDDWAPAGSVAAVRERLLSTRPDVLVIDHVEVFPGGATVPGAPPGTLSPVDQPGPLARFPWLLSLPHSACTKIVWREFLDKIDLRFTPGWYEDCAFSHLLLLAAERIDALDRVCYYYRQREGQAITKSTSVRHFDVFDQYDRVWQAVDRAGGAYDQFRPELFRLMINHLLVIAGNERRVPAELRRDFFQQMASAYRRHLPAGGYRVRGGITWLKHRLVRHNAYPAWAALRAAWRTARPTPALSSRRS